MTEIELMRFLDRKEEKYILKAAEFENLGKDKSVEYKMSEYYAIAYLKLRARTMFKDTKEISIDKLIKAFDDMKAKYDKLADKALDRGDSEAESEWLGVYMVAGWVGMDLKALSKTKKEAG